MPVIVDILWGCFGKKLDLNESREMKNMTKKIAMYLPQFHETEINNLFWGKGFTDWVTVKQAETICSAHRQPRIPLNNNYYDLSSAENIEWQAKLARQNGIDGFAIYHYWFSSEKRALDKPAELLLDHKNIDIDYMFFWDNSSWKRTWSNEKFANVWAPSMEKNTPEKGSSGLLLELNYGTKEDWKKHFNYLLPFFNDRRYIKFGNAPVFGIFNQNNHTPLLCEMFEYWKELAKENGFDDLIIIGKKNTEGLRCSDYQMLYEPHWMGWDAKNFPDKIIKKCINKIYEFQKKPLIYDFDTIWNKIIKDAENCRDKDVIYGAFCSYDDTPRRGLKGRIVKGSDPEKFGWYFSKLIRISETQKKPLVFITAWNEWGEGAYLEPDTEWKDGYLRAINN